MNQVMIVSGATGLISLSIGAIKSHRGEHGCGWFIIVSVISLFMFFTLQNVEWQSNFESYCKMQGYDTANTTYVKCTGLLCNSYYNYTCERIFNNDTVILSLGNESNVNELIDRQKELKEIEIIKLMRLINNVNP